MELKRLDAEDLDLVIKTLKEFLAREAPLEKRLKWDAEDHCPADVVKAMLGPEVGLHLVFLPAECDGMGGGAWDVYRMSCEFAKIDLGLATAMLAVALGSDPIRVGCTPEQQAKWLSRVANEGLIVAYGVTEPGAGSNVQSLATIAERITNDAGEITHYKLNGVKQFISNGSIADLYTILAKTPDGPTFFVVERNTPGLSAGKHEVKHGIRLSDTAQVLLQDVVIPAANLVGTAEGQGLKQANEVFGYTRLMVAAFGLGAGLSALEKAIAFSKERKQFGELLREKQGYTHKLLVPHSVRLAAAQAYIEYTANLLDSSTVDRQVEGSVAKLFATESGNLAADAAVGALGGYGYCVDYEVEKIRRDARILTIYEGTSEIQQSIIGVFRMRDNVRSKGKFYETLAAEVEGMTEVGGPDGRPRGALPLRGDHPRVPRQAHAPAVRGVRVRDVDDGGRDRRRARARGVALGQRPAQGAGAGLGKRDRAERADAPALGAVVLGRPRCGRLRDAQGARQSRRRRGRPGRPLRRTSTSSRRRLRRTRG